VRPYEKVISPRLQRETAAVKPVGAELALEEINDGLLRAGYARYLDQAAGEVQQV
jgi:hypothetical protein